MKPIPTYFQYWGKARPQTADGPAYHLLPYHALDVTAVADVLLQQAPSWRHCLAKALQTSENDVVPWVLMMTALHDLGKFSAHFQNQVPEIWSQLQGGQPNNLYAKPCHHSDLGYVLWGSLLATEVAASIYPEFPCLASMWMKPMMAASTCHHGQPPTTEDPKCDQYFMPENLAAAKAFTQEVLAFFQPSLSEEQIETTPEDEHLPGSFWLSGFIVLCDWMGSNQDYFPYNTEHQTLQAYYETVALPAARKMVAAVAVVPPPAHQEAGMHHLFPHYQATPLQDQADRLPLGDGPHLFIIEELTGAGKTEAALVLAQRLMAAGQADGLYFALPTMATADQMYDRLEHTYQRFYQPEAEQRASLVLAHGSRELHAKFTASLALENPPREQPLNKGGEGDDNASAWCAAWLGDHRKKSLLGAVGVGTVDQAMLAVLTAKHATLRLWGLVGKVLILDEIHAYDTYMRDILTKLIQFHTAAGGSTILLSATLPLALRKEFLNGFWQGLQRRPLELPQHAQGFPLLLHARADGHMHAHPVAARSPKQLAFQLTDQIPVDWVIARANEGDCVCWIRNTVHDARTAYENLVVSLGQDRVTLFHARFALGHRLDLQQDLLARFGPNGSGTGRRGRVVIATQVVEQSLDLDFDQMVSDLAPIDLLLQRAGRLRRHARKADGSRDPDGNPPDHRGIPELRVYTPPWSDDPDLNWYKQTFEKAHNVYPHTTILWRTHQILRTQPTWQLPDEARRAIESVYQDSDPPPGLVKAENRQFLDRSRHRSLAKLATHQLSKGYETAGIWQDPDIVATRLGIPSQSLRLAVWFQNQLIPLTQALGLTQVTHPGDMTPWRLSEVRIHHYQFHHQTLTDAAIAQAVTALNDQLPDRNRGTNLVVLTPQSDDLFVGEGIRKDSQDNEHPIILQYHIHRGLEVGDANQH